MKRLILIALLAVTLMPFTASADMIPVDHHSVDSCLEIENLSDFPDYDFIVSGDFKFSYAKTMTEGMNCSMNGSGVLAAILKSDWDSVEYYSDEEMYTEIAGDWPNLEGNADLILWSDLELSFIKALPDEDPTETEYQTVTINSLSEEGMDVAFAVDEVVDEEVEEPVDSEFPYTNALIVILGLIGLTVAFKVWKK
jgi:hypothetical protein